MGLVGGDEPLVDAEVERRSADPDEPAPVARCQFGRLGHFAQAEELTIEPPRGGLAARGHQEVDVIDPDDVDTIGHDRTPFT